MTPRIVRPVLVLLAVTLVAVGCRPSPSAVPAGSPAPGVPVTGTMAGRPYAAYLPADVGARRVPLVVFLHGGGGNATNAQGTTCADGDPSGLTCLQAVGLREGFVTVFASGTSRALTPALRTWNAAGGSAAYACVSGYACQSGADDVGYLRALVADLLARYPVDPARVYVMGFSNGAAMAHRVACEMADEVAAVVTVSGENEFATGVRCSPARPISVIEVHGTADRCWTYQTSTTACADQDPRPKVGEGVTDVVTRDWGAELLWHRVLGFRLP